MNKILKIVLSLFAGILMMSSCSPDEFNLGTTDVKPGDLVEGIAFKIEHDAANPNIVYLTSLMGTQYTPLWDHPQGRSQNQKVTLKMPFVGTYSVKFGVETRGGIVYGEPVTFDVADMYPDFISDPLWTLLAGGSDEEKTWYLDLDADALSRYYLGPLYFFGTDDSWETVTNGKTLPEGSDSWNWMPDYKGNSWLMTAADFGTMTFDLKGGAHVTVNHLTIPDRGTEKGTYMINTDEHTMRMNDAAPLHDINRDKAVVDWGNIKILSLTENTMQLAVLRDKALSGEDPCLLVYNFISKEYKDNWVPGEQPDPEPTLPAGWENDISQTVSSSVKWVLSPTTPFNWANLDGSLKNEWNEIADYPDWSGFNASIPATYARFSLTLNSEDTTAVYIAPDGSNQTGTYTLDEKGIYTFNGVNPSFNICSWVNLATSSENQWRITRIEKNISGKVTGMWVGVRDAVKPEYMVYHLIPTTGSSGDNEPKFKLLPVDNSKVVFGDLEEKGNLRIELYSEYGSSKPNPPINTADLVFSSKIEVTFTLSGITFIEGAPGSYNAGLEFADGSWGVQYWADGTKPNSNDTQVTGNGTYTVYFDTNGATSTGAMVFCVDVMNNIWHDIANTSAIGVHIDSIKLY